MARTSQVSPIVLVAVTLLQFFIGSWALNVTSITQCPALPARASPPTSVRDLRIDDIKVIGAMGDSIMAGFGLMGYDGGLDLGAILEYTGQSWGVGADDDAVTLATMTKRFSPNVKGGSRGSHLLALCNGSFCPLTHRPLRDKLNAAVSGSIAANLDLQLDYLIPMMKLMSENFAEDWKLITIQIGSNDQCAACGDRASEVAIAQYGAYVDKAIARIRAEVPRVIVNLVGVFKVSPVYSLTEGQAYCRPKANDSATILNRKFCGCFGSGALGRAKMDAHADGYNVQLRSIYNKYKSLQSSTFAVAFQPANINIGGFPITALSNFDCFHPSQRAHQWIAKSIWNGLFTAQSYKPSVLNFDSKLKIYCPTASDRIKIN